MSIQMDWLYYQEFDIVYIIYTYSIEIFMWPLECWFAYITFVCSPLLIFQEQNIPIIIWSLSFYYIWYSIFIYRTCVPIWFLWYDIIIHTSWHRSNPLAVQLWVIWQPSENWYIYICIHAHTILFAHIAWYDGYTSNQHSFICGCKPKLTNVHPTVHFLWLLLCMTNYYY